MMNKIKNILAEKLGLKKTIWNNQFFWSSIMLAVAIVLSYLQPLQFDEGGELTFFGMLALVMVGYFYGWKQMTLVMVCFIGAKLLIDSPFTGVYTPEGEYFDYIVGYGLMLIGGIYAHAKKNLAVGYMIAVMLRYVESIINCIVFYPLENAGLWENLLEGVTYSAKYVLVEGAITLLLIHIKPVKSAILYWKYVATHDKKIDLDIY